ncbi:TIGR03905 family TSCPD domain-containing protein [Clostridium brassicae]|uniref:ribonucleoside-diphosphate reductase n=1 Tax=Clostridium brassicae TaxID=2999072 RepID=A0ABT4DDW5_9CLOT|nr:TIGR03905 family TSCPD domain-containing protein [Clostridium brassicae]MCY6960383.1 TIGR03905 family TSCPD domain-containing protein [Clostridium brassicae]
MHIYKPTGVCSREISFDLENGKIKNVSFVGGCSGNLQGISSLVENMDINEVIKKLKGIKCGNKSTSCPDQLSKAIEALKNK